MDDAELTTTRGKKSLRNRIVGLEYLSPADIEDDPANWRIHPPEQRAALRSVLDNVGISGALIVYKHGDKYRLIDGHLRRSEFGTEKVPALLLDVNEREARVLLASMDSIGELRTRDDVAFTALLEEIAADESLTDLVRQIETDDMNGFDDDGEEENDAEAEYPIAATFDECYDYVVIFCRTSAEWQKVAGTLKLEKKQKAETAQRVGTSRVLSAEEFFQRWQARSRS